MKITAAAKERHTDHNYGNTYRRVDIHEWAIVLW